MNQVNTGDPTSHENRSLELYDEARKRVMEDIQSGTDSFDQSLLTLSTGALGLSLAFIKDIVPLKEAVHMRLLFASWLAFGACILLTVFSFPLSIAAQKKHLKYLAAYYLEQKEEFFDRRSGYSKALTLLTWAASLGFVSGLVCTLLFCMKNLGRYMK
jgi:hypothetical protein